MKAKLETGKMLWFGEKKVFIILLRFYPDWVYKPKNTCIGHSIAKKFTFDTVRIKCDCIVEILVNG